MAEQENRAQIKFEIVNARKEAPLTISGAFGSVSAQAAVVAHLYVEYPDIPPFAVMEFDPKSGAVLKNEMKIRSGHAIREIVSTLVMSPDVAESLGQWLKDQAVAANKVIAEQKQK